MCSEEYFGQDCDLPCIDDSKAVSGYGGLDDDHCFCSDEIEPHCSDGYVRRDIGPSSTCCQGAPDATVYHCVGRDPVCRPPCTLNDDAGTAPCPAGYSAVTNWDHCRTACDALDINFGGQQSDWGTDYPQGCFINTGNTDLETGNGQGCLMNTGAGATVMMSGWAAVCSKSVECCSVWCPANGHGPSCSSCSGSGRQEENGASCHGDDCYSCYCAANHLCACNCASCDPRC